MAILVTNVPKEDSEGPRALIVAETFEQAIDKVAPLQQYSSSLEARESAIWHDEEGNRVWIPPHYVALVYENDGEA